MGQLRDAAIKAGADTQYSATEAADAITEMAKAGVSAKDIMGGGLKGALSLAAAGQLDVADAAGIASHGDDAVQASRVGPPARRRPARRGRGQGDGLR
jgi:TP901 family phage tail tape measure protein